MQRKSNSVRKWLAKLGGFTLGEWLEYTSKTFTILYAILLALFLFISDKFSSILKLSAQQVTGAFVLMVAGFLVYFDRRMSEILARKAALPRQHTMREAFDELFSKYPRSRILRVYGSTTQLMVQWFEACQRKDETLYVKECKVLTHNFSEANFPGQSAHYNLIRDDSITKWKSFKQSDIIGNITFASTNVMPQVFAIILDEKAVIIGTYIRQKTGPTGLFDLKPLVIHGVEEAEKSIIYTYTQWFDAWFAESKTIE